MPQHFGDLRKCGTVAYHLRCKTMAKQVCGTPTGALDPGSRKRRANYVSYRGRTDETAMRRIHAPEDTPGLILGAVPAKVLG